MHQTMGAQIGGCQGVLSSGSKSAVHGVWNHPHPILSTHSEYSLSEFPYETVPRTHPPTDPSVSVTRIWGDDEGLGDNEWTLFQEIHRCSIHRKGDGKKQGSFRNGKKHGLWVKFRKNGQLESKGPYKDRKKHGP